MAQGKEIALQLDIPYLSAGQLVVQAIEKQTTQGLQAKPHVEAKSMIPDGLMSGMSKAKRSFSFPRPLYQAYCFIVYWTAK